MIGSRPFILVLAVLLFCSACATTPTAPSTTPSAAVHTPLADISPSLISGLTPSKLSGSGVDTTIPAVKGATALNLAAQIVRNKVLRERAKNGGTATVTWRPSASSDDLLGISLTTTRVDSAGNQRTVPVSLWYDETAHFVATGGVLIAPAHWDAFSSAVVAEVGARSGDTAKAAEALTLPGAPQGGGPALGFDSAGNLVVEFATGIGSDSASLTVTVDKTIAEPWLSDFGYKARGAAQYPTHYRPGLSDPAVAAPSTAASQSRPDIDVVGDCAARKCIALTFDDGPGPRTSEVAQYFVKADSGATFFMLGNQIQENPGTVTAVALTGNEIGSHTWRHRPLTESDSKAARFQLNQNAQELQKLTGDWPVMMRPPYGDHNGRIDKIVASEGQVVAQWGVDTLDWKTKAAEPTIASATSATTGSIVLMHDIHSWTVDAVPQIIQQLTASGHQLVPLAEVASPNSWTVGTAYCAAPWVARKCW